jgi:DNA-binding FadR family transcriptional regulator
MKADGSRAADLWRRRERARGEARVVNMEQVRVPKTAEVVAQAIRSQIVLGHIPEGVALPGEAELMSQFGVSRPSLREAFRILESEQLITVRRGAHGGARATRPDITVASRHLGLLMQVDGVLLSDVFQARALIEPIAMMLLAQRDNREAATRELRSVLDRFNPELSPREYAEIWLEFFLLLFELAGNKTLKLLYSTLTEVLRKELLDSISGPASGRRYKAAINTVDEALRLVADGKADEAADYWRDQMFLVEKDVARRHRDKTVVDVITNG